MTTGKELLKLKLKFLDRELKNLLIERSGLDRRNVNHVLNGRHKNSEVINVAYKILAEKAEELEKRKQYNK